MKMSKKQGMLIALSALVCGMTVTGCSNQEGDTQGAPSAQAGEKTGSMGLNLTLSNGVVVDSFQATITGAGLSAPVVRAIPVPNNGATVSALFGGLPQGDYTIELTATSVDGTSECGGDADFTILAQQTVGVTVPITCNTDSIRGTVTVNGDLNVCPDVNFLFVAPLQTAVGGPISVEADAEDPDGDPISFAWSATDGSFAATDVASTTYTCSAPGEQTITVTINDGGNCASMHQAVVNCEPTAVCGDDLVETDKGEECDPPDGVTCSATCQDIVVECGNSIVQPGEECDPADGVTCNAQCELIVCGDGVLEGEEECEAPFGGPGAGNCNTDCTTIPSTCGNSIVEPGEDCDDGAGSPTCSAACESLLPDYCAVCQEASCSAPLGFVEAECTGTTCDALLACQESSGCADTGDSRICYCGAVDAALCFGDFAPGPNQAGPCRAQIEAMAGTTVPIGIGQLWFDPDTALGALNQLSDCSATSCLNECF